VPIASTKAVQRCGAAKLIVARDALPGFNFQASIVEHSVNGNSPVPVESVDHPLLSGMGIELLVRREDRIHPQISGNKWHKLKYNLAQAAASGCTRLLSFGGAFSNHLHTLAYAGQQHGLQTVGIIRGELPRPLNPSLQDMMDWGMTLVPVSRSEYKKRHQAEYRQQLMAQFGPCYLVPEGGSNLAGLRGCIALGQVMRQQASGFDLVTVPCGTGVTLAGLACGFYGSDIRLWGFSALRGACQQLTQNITALTDSAGYRDLRNWQLVDDFHCGGFARVTPELVDFLDDWRLFSEIPLEPLYTGKMFYGLFQLIAKAQLPEKTRILALHTGGL